MNTVVKTKFAVKPVVAALALAFAAVNADALPTPTQLPGAGLIRGLSVGTTITAPNTFYCVQTGGVGCIAGTGSVGDQIYNGSLSAPFFPGSIQLNNAGTIARAVIQWGGFGGSLESYNPAGFNIGANATVFFTSSATVTSAAVLNVDASGNPSQIYGKLIGTSAIIGGASGGGAAPAIFVSNANGIIVGPTGQIQGPNGVGLIGANMNNATAIFEFVGSNGLGSPGVYGQSYVDVTGGQSKVEVQGFIDGGIGPFLSNLPAAYILLAGGDVVNSGNLFASNVHVFAGVRATPGQTATVNGISAVPVQRLFNVDTSAVQVDYNEGLLIGNVEISKAGATFVNTGSISSKAGVINVEAAGGIRSGTQGSLDPLIGLYADSGLNLDVLEDTGSIALYNQIRGFSTGVTLPYAKINQHAGWGGDVIIDLLTPGSAPSSLTTTGIVAIRGANTTINSTINHNSAGINFADLVITSKVSLTTTATGDIGAGGNVIITNTAAAAGGMNLAGDVTGGTDLSFGGVYITNNAVGATTTITGNVLALGGFGGGFGGENADLTVNGPLTVSSPLFASYDFVDITNNKGPTVLNGGLIESVYRDINVVVNGALTISSNMSADGVGGFDGDVNVTNNSLTPGNITTISGNIFAFYDINLTNNGGTTTALNVSGNLNAGNSVNVFSGGSLQLAKIDAGNDINIEADGLTAGLNGPMTAVDEFNYVAFNATTKIVPTAVITANSVFLNVLNFRGVNAAGLPYVNIGEKPAAQIVSNFVEAIVYGSLNAPIAGNTNWLNNEIRIAAQTSGFPVFFDVSAIGGGFQAINVGVTGDAAFSSGITRTPFDIVGFNSSILLPPPLVANGGSQLILQSTGNMDINGNGAPFLLAPNAFEFPGGVAFVAGRPVGAAPGVITAGTFLSQNVPVYNAWTLNPIPFGGVFYESNNIIGTSYTATNQGSWVNWSSFPVTGLPQVFTISQPAPGLFQFVDTPFARHYNVYSKLIAGTAGFCNTGNPPAPWPPAGC